MTDVPFREVSPMFSLSLSPIAPPTLAGGPASTEDGAKPGDGADAFATLLGALGASAAGAPAKLPDTRHAPLPESGKLLPDGAEVEVDKSEPVAADISQPDDPAMLVQAFTPSVVLPIAVLEPAILAVGPVEKDGSATVPAPVPAPPKALIPHSATVRSNAKFAAASATASSPGSPTLAAVLIAALSPAPAQAGVSVPGKPDDKPTKPDTARPVTKLAVALPAHAAFRALIEYDARTTEPGPPAAPPVLPEQAAARASVALAARGNPERPVRSSRPEIAIFEQGTGETGAEPPVALLRPLADILTDRRPSVELQSPLAAALTDGEPTSTPQATASHTPAATPTMARHDFAAMVDRLIDARDLAGAQPASMTLHHDDFGAVSLRFRSADDGLTVTMASPDPDFARAVNAAVAQGATSSPGDMTRPSGDQGSLRHGGSTAASEDLAGQSRSNARSGERETSRQRGDPPPPHRSAPRQQGRSGIFA